MGYIQLLTRRSDGQAKSGGRSMNMEQPGANKVPKRRYSS